MLNKPTKPYSKIRINPNRFIGFVGLFSILLSFVAAVYAKLLFTVHAGVVFFSLFFVFQALMYFMLLLSADSKGKFVESILPDVLQLTASNLRAGLTTEKALLLSARPEFGLFQEELNRVGKEITLGKDIGEALIEMSFRIRSDKLQKTIELVVAGLNAGGELAALLEQTSNSLRKEMIIDDKIKANAMMYVIFIFVAVCFGAPALFGLSSFLVEVLKDQISNIDAPSVAGAGLSISFSEVPIEISFIIMFSVTFLVTSSVLGAMILGLIAKGKEREGIKFMPFLIMGSLGVFFLTRFMIKTILGGMFGIG